MAADMRLRTMLMLWGLILCMAIMIMHMAWDVGIACFSQLHGRPRRSSQHRVRCKQGQDQKYRETDQSHAFIEAQAYLARNRKPVARHDLTQ